MKPFHNGTLITNVLLVAGGALAGSALTWSLTPRQSDAMWGADSAFSGAETTMAPVPAAGGGVMSEDETSVKLEQIMSADNPEHKASDLSRLGRDVATGNVQAALDMASGIGGETDRMAFVRGTFVAWAAQDPQAAASYAATNFPAGMLRSEAIRVSVGQWAQKDPRSAFQWMEANLSGPLKEESLVALAQGWSRRSPQQAASWFAETGSTSQPLLTAIAGTWAQQDPASALQWASQLRDTGNRSVGLTSALGEMARQDPAAAALAAEPYLGETSSNDPATAAIRDLPTVLADIWGTTDPAAAAQWISKLPTGASQIEAAGTLATVWASSDIEAAVAWSSTISDPSLKGAVVSHLGTTWGAIEPDQAIAWLDTLPADVASQGISGAFNSWAATDPLGLNDWITQLEPGPRSDLARRSLGDVMADQEPLAALELAAGIADPIQQSDVLARYYRQFHRSDAASAIEWLQGEWTRLPAPAQQSLAREQQKLVERSNRTAG